MFAYHGYFITVPTEIDTDKIYAKTTIIPNPIGIKKLRTSYLYKNNNWFLGASDSYEQQENLLFLAALSS